MFKVHPPCGPATLFKNPQPTSGLGRLRQSKPKPIRRPCAWPSRSACSASKSSRQPQWQGSVWGRKKLGRFSKKRTAISVDLIVSTSRITENDGALGSGFTGGFRDYGFGLANSFLNCRKGVVRQPRPACWVNSMFSPSCFPDPEGSTLGLGSMR